MGYNKTKVTGFRIENEEILLKLNVIAERHCRTRNKEVEYALMMYVADYENQFGEITETEYQKYVKPDLKVAAEKI